MLAFNVICPYECCYYHVEQAHKYVDCIQPEVMGFLRQTLCSQFNFEWQSKVTEREKPVSKVERRVADKLRCLNKLMKKTDMVLNLFVRSVVEILP